MPQPPSKRLAAIAAVQGRGPIDYEIAGEMASALGRAGEKAESCLARLREHAGGESERRRLRAGAARAVHAYFIQREMCGLRRHEQVIREMKIPREVLVRLGAS